MLIEIHLDLWRYPKFWLLLRNISKEPLCQAVFVAAMLLAIEASSMPLPRQTFHLDVTVLQVVCCPASQKTSLLVYLQIKFCCTQTAANHSGRRWREVC